MSKDVIDSVFRLLEAIFGSTVGESDFNVMLGICVFAWVLAARSFMVIFSSKRGIFAAFFAFLLPVSLGLLAYALAELYVVPAVDYKGWGLYAIPSAAFGLLVFLSVLIIAKRIWALPGSVSLFIYIVATAAAVGVYFGVQVTMGVLEYGESQVEQRDRRVKSEIDSLL